MKASFGLIVVLAYTLGATSMGCVGMKAERREKGVENGDICEVPEWLIAGASSSAGSRLLDSFVEERMSPNRAVSPRLAAFIYCNLFHMSSWDAIPLTRMFVSKEIFICTLHSGDIGNHFNDFTALPSSLVIRASDGAVYDKRFQRWRRMGYVNDSASIICESVIGRNSSAIIRRWGTPYEANGVHRRDDGVMDYWEVYLSPAGLHTLGKGEENPQEVRQSVALSEERLMDWLRGASSSRLIYWCLDGRIVIKLEKDQCLSAQKEERSSMLSTLPR